MPKKSKTRTNSEPEKEAPSFFEKVYEMVRKVPKGRATTYGAIAECAGIRLSARMVGWALNGAGRVKPKVPAHRVVNRNGMLSGKHHFETPTLMQELLESEGIIVKNDTIQDFKTKVFWDPADHLTKKKSSSAIKKYRMSVLKLKLDQDQLVEDFFDETFLVGIASAARDYQLCWQLNRQLHYDFRVNNSLEIKLTKGPRSFFFAVSEFQEPTKTISHYLYNNHCKGEFLLPELKHIHYIWLIKGNYYQQEDIKKLIEQLRYVEQVQLVSLLDIRDIKNKMNLIF